MRKITLVAIALFPLVANAFKTSEYLCTANDVATQIAYQGKAFKVTISGDCINLINLDDKTMEWSWRVSLRNSLGDIEASRKFCNKEDDGLIGSPAIWRHNSRVFTTFNEKKLPTSFSCHEVK